jgi:hypothetical protein
MIALKSLLFTYIIVALWNVYSLTRDVIFAVNVKVKVKVKFTLEQATKAQKGSWV